MTIYELKPYSVHANGTHHQSMNIGRRQVYSRQKKKFSCDEVIARDKTSLDITGLKNITCGFG